MKLKVTRDEYFCFALVPDELDYDDLEIEVTREEAGRITLAYEEFSNAQEMIKTKLRESIAG